MNYSGIIRDDIANGLGIRTSLFVSGCRNNCPGCFNVDAQDFTYGYPFTEAIENYIISTVDTDYHSGITLLGGDPMEPENAEALLSLVEKFRKKFDTDKNIWLYTGYIFENILKLDDNDPRKILLGKVDIVVDGPFIESLKDITLKFRGSSNQRIIDVKMSTIDNIYIIDD